ncbi:hypothetical protein ACIRP5_11175 [Streptomyces sp. NPDC101221]|uniref:hypothetical protein n=1 Tax=Streptomyces sp. NPDC101221 TaxID=3366132 RepID=UPI003814615B
MARLQILELPEGSNDDRPPFVLVVDQCVPQRIALGADATFGDYWQNLADKIGARGVIVTPETVDIPANDTSAYLAPPPKQELVVKLNGDMDMDAVRSAIAADMQQLHDANDQAPAKPRRDWCCSLAFQTLGKQHIDDCRQAQPDA